MSQLIDQDMLAGFAAEARSYLPKIRRNIGGLKGVPEDAEALEEAHRLVHNIKGASAMVGLGALSGIASLLEEGIEQVGGGQRACDRQSVAMFEQAVQAIEAQLESIDEGSMQGLGDPPAGGDEFEIGGDSSVEFPLPEDGMDAVPAELLEVFRMEAADLLRAIGEHLHGLESVADPRSALAEVRRSVHTLKGAAGSVGLDSIRRLAHRMEDLLDAIHEDVAGFSPAVGSLLLATFDRLHDMAAGTPAEAFGPQLQSLYARYDALLSPDAAPRLQPSNAPEPSAATQPRPEPRSQHVRVPIERLDEMVRLVSELVVSRSTFEQHLKAYSLGVEELQLALRRLERIAAQIDGGGSVFARGGEFRPAAPSAHEFDTLELDRYTAFQILTHDLRETVSDLDTAAGELAGRAGDFDNYLVRHARLTSEVQDRFMHMRMVPLAALATRLRRTVRVAAEARGTQVDLVIEGERVELDKTVIEDLAGPLEHLLRNAVDHGIEGHSVRLAQGKPARGRIVLRARYEGTQAVIEVSDDGAGLRTGDLAEAAVRAGMCSPDEALRMPASQLHDLIYQQGITTAPEITQSSGRGVGMDAVKTAVSRLKGVIQVESEPGRGAVFTIRLPLTLAVMRALLVRSSGETFAIPMAVITQVLRVTPDRLERVGRQTVLRTSGQVLPAVHLGAALQLKHPPDHSVRAAPVLVIEMGGRKLALLVDHIIEAREVVIKKLGSLLGNSRGVTGATLMGDGGVVLIVNPDELMAAAEVRGPKPATRQPVSPGSVYNVLIVDDSVSVRRVLASFMRKAGCNPITARDGVEALEILEHGGQPPDVALLDIEMPRMDGYELTAAIRANPALRGLPLIMLSSRAGEKHRQKAFQLGATAYLAKPYEEDTLLGTIRRVVNEARADARGQAHATLQ